MNQKQIKALIAFAKPYYKKTGKWHGWDHISAVRNHAINISKEYPKADESCVEAAAIIHDMGRTVKDDGHGKISGQIAKPFLKSIGVPTAKTNIIIDAAANHEIGNIDNAKTIEARIVFDADKIEILTTYGFLRVAYWLVEERNMELGEAVNFLWDYCQKFKRKLHSDYAKKMVAKEWPQLQKLVKDFNKYERTWRKN